MQKQAEPLFEKTVDVINKYSTKIGSVYEKHWETIESNTINDNAGDKEIFDSSGLVNTLKEKRELKLKSHTKHDIDNRDDKEIKKELFHDSDDIFTNIPKAVSKKLSNRLFGSDDESEGELFHNENRSNNKAHNSSSVSKLQEQSKNKSLFNDSSSDDDDLFSGSHKEKNESK